MMHPRKLYNGNLLIPVTAKGPNGELGDGFIEIGPDHPEYETWLAAVEPEESEDCMQRLIDLIRRDRPNL